MRTLLCFLAGLLGVALQVAVAPAADVLRAFPIDDGADGVELAGSAWYNQGLPEYGGDLTGGIAAGGAAMEPAFQFLLPGYVRGDSVACARIRFTSLGGQIPDTLRLRIRGLLWTSTLPFGPDNLPSHVPQTVAAARWKIPGTWVAGTTWDPFYVDGPDLAPVVNEILASHLWPASGDPPGALAVRVQVDAGQGPDSRFCRFADSGTSWHPVELEVRRHMEDAFLAPPLLGRPTDQSVAVTFAHLVSLDCYVAYGTAPGVYQWAQGATRTLLPLVDPLRGIAAEEGREILLSGLDPDRRYYLRLFYRRAGRTAYDAWPEITFHTRRAAAEPFVFSILTDPHLEDAYKDGNNDAVGLYRIALENAARDTSDFLFDLGDYAVNLKGSVRIRALEEARRIYSDERAVMGEAGCSLPFYLALGNHEGEVGWMDDGSENSHFTWSARARKEFVPNPEPDAFYSGNQQLDPNVGHPQDYYSWEWGDALFVVLDPFRYTMVKPDFYGEGGSGDAWDWTLGRDQYDWLEHVLSSSQKKWKFVFLHHMTGGVFVYLWGYYGRGGIESVRYAVDGHPSFEWGGEDGQGNYVFPQKRPGFGFGSIHEMLVRNGVTAVFHGHDHCYGHQEWDGIVYQECPQASNPDYLTGFCDRADYTHGVMRPNSGHLRVTVSSDRVRVDYVRAFLPGDGENGVIDTTYEIGPTAGVVAPGSGHDGVSGSPADPGSDSDPGGNDRGGGADRVARSGGARIALDPVPCRGTLSIRSAHAWEGEATLTLFDMNGRALDRLVARAPARGQPIRWDLRGPGGRPLASGVYAIGWARGRESERHKILVLH